MSPESPDHCATLGIRRGASNEELHAAYRRLALMHHPDKNRGNEEVATAKFQEVQRAFEALRDTEDTALPPPDVPVGAQWDARTTPTTPTPTPATPDTARTNNTSNDRRGSSWFDANWDFSSSNFDRRSSGSSSRRWNDDNDENNWFDERGWRTRSTAFASQHHNQHPGFGVFGRFFTHLPPLPPLDVRSNNWRESSRSFRLFV